MGQVPNWLEVVPESAADHSWGVVRDLLFAETELPAREKALIGLGAASAMGCEYCIHFHREEAKLEDVTEDELEEAVNLAASVKYFSTIIHGAETDLDEFKEETGEIVDYIQEQEAAAAGAD
jgi:AhpD family alkylhydroperoxidase